MLDVSAGGASQLNHEIAVRTSSFSCCRNSTAASGGDAYRLEGQRPGGRSVFAGLTAPLAMAGNT